MTRKAYSWIAKSHYLIEDHGKRNDLALMNKHLKSINKVKIPETKQKLMIRNELAWKDL